MTEHSSLDIFGNTHREWQGKKSTKAKSSKRKIEKINQLFLNKTNQKTKRNILKWISMMLVISLYFFVFFYIIKLAGTNELDSTNNRRESVYTHKQKEINYTCLAKRLRDVFKKTNTLQHHNIFINKSEGEIKVHFTKCNTNK